MSDLLPLVIAALKDKSLVDAKEELDDLQRRVETFTSIEIIHGATAVPGDVFEDDDVCDIIVYASGKLEDGEVQQLEEGVNFWQVDMDKNTSHSNEGNNSPACKLKDLGKCHVCTLGGLSNHQLVHAAECFMHETDGEIRCGMRFVANFSLWVHFTIDGWPKEEWKPFDGYPFSRHDPLLPRPFPDESRMVQYFQQTVAKNHPEATVNFESIAIKTSRIQGPLRRVLTNSRKQQVKAEQKKKSHLREIINRLVAQNEELRLSSIEGVVEFSYYCGLHNYMPTDEEGIAAKSRLLLQHLQLRKEEGTESLWERAPVLKEQIRNLISQQSK